MGAYARMGCAHARTHARTHAHNAHTHAHAHLRAHARTHMHTRARTQGCITVNAEWDGTDVEVSVADTGIGMPEDKLEQIFLAFKQVWIMDSVGCGQCGV
jgi:light-regulated signal transduction histidine kinase (bacteriophytochrome)